MACADAPGKECNDMKTKNETSKAAEALPHLERCAHHFALAAKALGSYVVALGGNVAREHRPEAITEAAPKKSPPRAEETGAGKAKKTGGRKPKRAPENPTPAPSQAQPGFWGGN